MLLQASLSQLPCPSVDGLIWVAFRLLTGIRFVATVAGGFSTSSCPERLVLKLPSCGNSFIPALANRISNIAFRFNLMFRFFRTGCCTSATVAGSFFTTSLSGGFSLSYRNPLCCYHC
jgi:hypothetical protein